VFIKIYEPVTTNDGILLPNLYVKPVKKEKKKEIGKNQGSKGQMDHPWFALSSFVLFFVSIVSFCASTSALVSTIVPPFVPCGNQTVFGTTAPCASYTSSFNVTVFNSSSPSLIPFNLKGVFFGTGYQKSLAFFATTATLSPPPPFWLVNPYNFSLSLLADGVTVASQDYQCIGEYCFKYLKYGVKTCRPDPDKNWELAVSMESGDYKSVVMTFAAYVGANVPGVDLASGKFENCPLWTEDNWSTVLAVDGALLAFVGVGYVSYMYFKKKRLQKGKGYHRL